MDCSMPGLPCPSPSPRVCSNSCPSSRWCHPSISFSVTRFSFCLQSFPASGSFPMNQFFPSGGQSIWVSASPTVLAVNTQDWFPLELMGLIALQSKGLLRVFSSTTFEGLSSLALSLFMVQLSNPYMITGKKKNSCDYTDISEKAMAPHSSTLPWKIPWKEEPGGLQSMGLLRVRHDWVTSL